MRCCREYVMMPASPVGPTVTSKQPSYMPVKTSRRSWRRRLASATLSVWPHVHTAIEQRGRYTGGVTSAINLPTQQSMLAVVARLTWKLSTAPPHARLDAATSVLFPQNALPQFRVKHPVPVCRFLGWAVSFNDKNYCFAPRVSRLDEHAPSIYSRALRAVLFCSYQHSTFIAFNAYMYSIVIWVKMQVLPKQWRRFPCISRNCTLTRLRTVRTKAGFARTAKLLLICHPAWFSIRRKYDRIKL